MRIVQPCCTSNEIARHEKNVRDFSSILSRQLQLVNIIFFRLCKLFELFLILNFSEIWDSKQLF